MAQSDVVVTIGKSGFQTTVQAGEHTFTADEPKSVGGTNQGPSPYDYLIAALGACTAMTVRMYADREKWPLDSVKVTLGHSRIHEKDCEECEERDVGLDQIERSVELSGDLTEEQHLRLIKVADRCPVGQSLERGVRILPSEPS